MGGRSPQQGQPGSGADFLDFHHKFVADVKIWYATQPGHDMTKLDPWLHFPPDLVAAHPELAGYEAKASDGSSFLSEDALGIYVEAEHNNVHGFIAALYNQPEFGGFDSCVYFMFYQWHGMIDAWRGHWLTSHKSAVKDLVDHGVKIKDVVEVPKIIRDGIPKHFEVPVKGAKELAEVPGRVDVGDPMAQLSQRVAQLEVLVANQQAFIGPQQRPPVG
jgi:hypothetical protein